MRVLKKLQVSETFYTFQQERNKSPPNVLFPTLCDCKQSIETNFNRNNIREKNLEAGRIHRLTSPIPTRELHNFI